MSELGELCVLSVGRGDLRIRFDRDDPADRDRAKRIIQDLLKRGYALFVETPEGLRKVKRFDPAAEEYVVQDAPEEPKKRGAYKNRRLPMRSSRATGIAPTAGG